MDANELSKKYREMIDCKAYIAALKILIEANHPSVKTLFPKLDLKEQPEGDAIIAVSSDELALLKEYIADEYLYHVLIGSIGTVIMSMITAFGLYHVLMIITHGFPVLLYTFVPICIGFLALPMVLAFAWYLHRTITSKTYGMF